MHIDIRDGVFVVVVDGRTEVLKELLLKKALESSKAEPYIYGFRPALMDLFELIKYTRDESV